MTALITIGIIYLIGFCWLGYEIKNAPEVPKDLEDLF
jgi:hypothetical protein